MDLSRGGARPPVLIVGVGSELRSDDAAGRRVAELLVGQQPPDDVEVRVVHQLTPELADDMTGRELVVVVDASVEVREVVSREVVQQVDVARVGAAQVDAAGAQGEGVTAAMSHHVDPAALVGLCRVLGEAPKRVVTVAVPAFDLTLGTELSPGTAGAVSEAVARTRGLCRDVLGPG